MRAHVQSITREVDGSYRVGFALAPPDEGLYTFRLTLDVEGLELDPEGELHDALSAYAAYESDRGMRPDLARLWHLGHLADQLAHGLATSGVFGPWPA